LSGGKCERCLKRFPIWMYDFHHTDPTNKLFSLSSNNLLKGWKAVLEEWKKCILVCPNCHRIEHARLEGRLDYGVE
jgi:predicted HNH restriction endonuclease